MSNRNDPTPRKIDRWLVFQTLCIYIYILYRTSIGKYTWNEVSLWNWDSILYKCMAKRV